MRAILINSKVSERSPCLPGVLVREIKNVE